MKSDGETVGFIAQGLEDVKGRGVLRESDRLELARKEDFFFLFGQRKNRDFFKEAELFQGLDRRPQLAFPAVDQNEVRIFLPAFL